MLPAIVHGSITCDVFSMRIVRYGRARSETAAIRSPLATTGRPDDPVDGTRPEHPAQHAPMTEHTSSDDATPQGWTTDDGDALTLRGIRPDDVDAMLAFVRNLSFAARYFRFGKGDIEFTADDVRRVCSPNPRECVHFVVAKRGDPDEIVGSARIVFAAGASESELAITVADAWQTRGVGRRLIEALMHGASRRGITQVHAEILATNLAMIEFMQRRGFVIADSPKGPGLKVATTTV